MAIGQRALLCRTATGNLLWDCITYIDDETVSKINELGGLKGIVISHPHFYTTHLHWAEIFDCPVYLAREDREWVVCPGERQVFWDSGRLSVPGVEGDLVAVKTGGHFPGSSVLWWRSLGVLLVADSIGVVPSGIYHVGRLPGTVSFTFMWSYPNMVCLFLGFLDFVISCLVFADGYRYLCLRMKCIISGGPLRIWISMISVVVSWEQRSTAIVNSVCWRVLRSLSSPWDISTMQFVRNSVLETSAMYIKTACTDL